MKKIILILLCLFCITGCSSKKNEFERNNYDDSFLEYNGECCEGCMCGDTIRMLKNYETAWTLTEINSNGDYNYDRFSFINFHGPGKDKFAFFKNDDNANPISEVRGEFFINDSNEIILTSDSDKENVITCKLGEEKDLIAIMNCDNDFGTFTLQKQGATDLPDELKDAIARTKSIKINGKRIKDAEKINILLSVINNSKVWTGPINLPSAQYELKLFDSKRKIIAKIKYNPSHYFSIEIDDKNYNLINIDKKKLDTLLVGYV